MSRTPAGRLSNRLLRLLVGSVAGPVLVAGLVVGLPATSASATAPTAATLARSAVDPLDPSTWSLTRGHYTPAYGAKFNNPYGTTSARRTILSHVIRTINAVPGYVRPQLPDGSTAPCPENNPALYPAEIKIALYSIADRAFTTALINAHRRCVSVKVLMNSHLDVNTSPSWRRLINNLGTRPGDAAHQDSRRSFAYRCTHGCLGSAVLHTKMYLFSSVSNNGSLTRDVTMTGSSNMTSNAVKVQWNDMFTMPGNRTVYDDYRAQFMRMVRDHTNGHPRVLSEGPYTTTFYPFFSANRSTDLTMRALNTIRCTGATGGTGIGGRTVLHIAMHSWHGTRGKYLAERVREMYNRGCYVRILYSFMGHGTYSLLTHGTGSRMVARRVLFPGPSGLVAAKYSHMKMFAASGNVAGDSSASVVWTGSNNWSDRSIRCDEVTLRIASRSVYDAYVNHWNFMRARRSSSVWAIYPEPGGGGRAPDNEAG